jgi:probable F420-dependent oxidoreductase
MEQPMTKFRPFRFGTGAYQARTRDEYLALVRKVEQLGYGILLTPDHFAGQLAVLPALLAAADATPTLRIGSYVFANDFRHPAVLANDAATVDLLSGGRFEFGIGAGYLTDVDYTPTGIPFDPAGVRVSRLVESVQIIKGLWSDEPVTFAGTYYTVTGLTGYPKPHQRPHPPVLIAGGSKRVLSLAAREADIVGLLTPSQGGALDLTASSTASTTQQVAWVRQAAGDHFADLEFNTLVIGVEITDHRQRMAEDLARRIGLTSEQVLDSVHFLVGTVEQITEDIQMWRERFGISYVAVVQEYMDALAPVVARLAGT